MSRSYIFEVENTLLGESKRGGIDSRKPRWGKRVCDKRFFEAFEGVTWSCVEVGSE